MDTEGINTFLRRNSLATRAAKEEYMRLLDQLLEQQMKDCKVNMESLASQLYITRVQLNRLRFRRLLLLLSLLPQADRHVADSVYAGRAGTLPLALHHLVALDGAVVGTDIEAHLNLPDYFI